MDRLAKLLFYISVFILILNLQFWLVSSQRDRVNLRNIDAITLYAGKKTNSRRTRSVDQLQCIGGSARCKGSKLPRVVQCYNRGFDGRDVQWECKADVPTDVKLGRVTVNCEGYEDPDDYYVLHNSWALEYELDYTDKRSRSYFSPSSNTSVPFIFVLVAFVIAGYSLYKCITPDTSTSYTHEVPPPTYEQSTRSHADPSHTHSYGFNVPSSEGDTRFRGQKQDTSAGSSIWSSFMPQGGLSSFLAGAGLGGAAGYAAGSSSRGSSTSAFGGSSYTRERNNDSFFNGSGHYSRSRSSSPETHTSTSYGGTTRR